MSDSLTTRFDQLDLDEHPYGKCNDCAVSLRDKEIAHEHMMSSRHGVRILNPDRSRRIEREVSWEIEAALDEAFSTLYRLVEDGDVTAGEIETALAGGACPDLEWRRYVEENS